MRSNMLYAERTSCHIESKEKNLYITYSVKTKSTGRKKVLMLSTMRPISGITKDDGKSKPAIMKFYDFTKEEPMLSIN